MRTASIFCLLLTCSLLVSGCGYHLGPATPSYLRGVKTLAIPTFKNRTLEPRLEVLMADTLIKQFQRDGTFEIVSDNKADAILYCTLTKTERRQARPVPSNVLATAEFLLIIHVEYELINRVTGAIITEGNLVTNTSFFSNADIQTDERQAIVTAIEQFSKSLTANITEGF